MYASSVSLLLEWLGSNWWYKKLVQRTLANLAFLQMALFSKKIGAVMLLGKKH